MSSKFIKFLIAIALVNNANAFASSGPLALLGGQGPAPYAAFLEENGTIEKLQGLPSTGLTYRVAINHQGFGIIGGTDNLNAYAALVSPQGILNPVPGLIAPGEIYTVAINESRHSIIGGGHLNTNIPFAAFVSPNGTPTPLAMPPSGLIYSVAIDSSGEGLIGGIGPANSAYASIAAPNGTVTPIAGLPANGAIFWVASNNSKTRFIGGQDNTSVYAAFISSNGTLEPVSGLPSGLLYSVAMNASGAAIIGGASLNLPYAALVARNGTVTTLDGLPTTAGKIYNVAINDSRTALIGGFSAAGPYASFVSPDGALIPIKGLPVGDGFVDGLALHSSGVGIVGGTSFNTPFAALVAPNGTLTYLSGLPPTGEINSISIAMLDGLVPNSIGPFDSWANTQFALSDALTQHCIMHPNARLCGCCSEIPTTCWETGNTSLWLSLIGNYVRERKQHSIPSFSNKIGGVLLGVDYNGIDNFVVGAGFAYAHNDVHYRQNRGSASINQESGVLYATYCRPYFFLNAALWAGGFQATNHRRSLSLITSKAKPTGWNISPHLELSVPIQISCQNFEADPFVALDWVNNWQNHYRESGFSGFNVRLKDHHTSIFRTEAGVRFYESFCQDWGQIFLEEKISYVNRTPIHKGRTTAAFIGAFSTFDVVTLNSEQNMGVVQLHMECVPSCLNKLYASLDYQGGFGPKIQSHMLTFSIGKSF